MSRSNVAPAERLGRRGRLLLGPIVLCVLDVALTLHGQSDAYWTAGYVHVEEGNPLARWLLLQHPATLLVGVAVWIFVFSTAIVRLPDGLARVVAFVVLISHTFGASTWLIQQPAGYLWCSVLWLAALGLDRLLWKGT